MGIQRQEVPLEHVKTHLHDLTAKALIQYPDEHLLFFWTHLAFIGVAHDRSSQPTSSSYSKYADQLRPRIQDQSGNDIGPACKTHTARRGQEDGLQEFLAIRQRQILDVPESLAKEICPPVTLAL